MWGASAIFINEGWWSLFGAEKKVQTIFSTRNTLKKGSEWGFEIMLSRGSCNSRGVAMLLKRGVDFSIQSKILDPLGRLIILKAEIADYLCINKLLCPQQRQIVKFFQWIDIWQPF